LDIREKNPLRLTHLISFVIELRDVIRIKNYYDIYTQDFVLRSKYGDEEKWGRQVETE